MTAPVKLVADLGQHLRTLPAKGADTDVGKRIREQAARVVAYVGHKQAAAELDTQESTLSHMLAGRGQRYLRLDWAPYLAAHAPDLGFARSLVEPAGLLVEKAPQVTVEESLIGLLAAMHKFFGQQVMTPLLEDAHREALLEASKRRGGG